MGIYKALTHEHYILPNPCLDIINNEQQLGILCVFLWCMCEVRCTSAQLGIITISYWYFIADNSMRLSPIHCLFTYIFIIFVTFVPKLAIIATFSRLSEKVCCLLLAIRVTRVPSVTWKKLLGRKYLCWRDFILRSLTFEHKAIFFLR